MNIEVYDLKFVQIEYSGECVPMPYYPKFTVSCKRTNVSLFSETDAGVQLWTQSMK